VSLLRSLPPESAYRRISIIGACCIYRHLFWYGTGAYACGHFRVRARSHAAVHPHTFKAPPPRRLTKSTYPVCFHYLFAAMSSKLSPYSSSSSFYSLSPSQLSSPSTTSIFLDIARTTTHHKGPHTRHCLLELDLERDSQMLYSSACRFVRVRRSASTDSPFP
jgi:hypothetical protein